MKNTKTKIGMFINGFRRQDNQAKIKVSHLVWITPTAIAAIIFAILFSGAKMSVCQKYIYPFKTIEITYNLYDKWLIYGLIFAFFLGLSVFLTIKRYDKETSGWDRVNTASLITAIIAITVGGIIEFKDDFYAGGGYGFICFFLFMYFAVHLATMRAKKTGKILTGYNSTGPKIFAVKDFFTSVGGSADWLKSSIACADDDCKFADE